jgi:hypothetical protein
MIKHTDFMEAKHTESDWFSVFTLGHERPGMRIWLDQNEKDQGVAQGWKPQSVDYFINDWRYRGRMVPAMGASAAFGCSYTFGYGVNIHWPGMLDAVNCGINGASNDLIARLAIAYCKTFKPTVIHVLWTFKERREYISAKGGLDKFKNLSDEAIKAEMKSPTWISGYASLMNSKADDYNYKKNKMLLTSYCVANDIELKQTHISQLPKDDYPLARDNDHPGHDWHTNMAGMLCL